MKSTETPWVGLASVASLAVTVAAHAQGGRLSELPAWRPIATTADGIPGTGVSFGSFNQPAVNRNGVVVFRARSVGSSEPVSGVFRRRMNAEGQPIEPLFLRGGEVPAPNNAEASGSGSGETTGFREFPSVPRIDAESEIIATRGNSTPVWTYLLPDGSETRVGTNGVFVAWNGERVTAFSLLGAVRDAETGALQFPWFSVPDAPEGTRFDVFPGSPSVTGGRYVVTKANWTDPETSIGKTGIFVRDLHEPEGMLRRIASSDTVIPGQDPEIVDPVKFGSTAPPAAANGTVVFLGVDSEEAPTMGGLYAAPITGEPTLTELVMIGDPVPGAGEGEVFTRLGEGGAFNGRFVAFWGAWGTEMREITLSCPTDGNPDIIAYCNELHPAGYTVEIPVHQGVFMHDLVTGTTSMVAQTGTGEGDITDFVYWSFSGRAPDTGGGSGGGGKGEGGLAEEEGDDGELARWRSATFIAVEGDQWIGGSGNACRVGFKATAGETVGIYLRDTAAEGEVSAALAVGGPMSAIDPSAGESVVITTLSLEREALRDGWFVVAASGTDEATGESVSGIYASGTRRQNGDVDGDGKSEIAWFHESDRLAAVWHVGGDAIEGGYMSTRPNEPGSRMVGSGDANGDGRADLLWYDPNAKRYSVWIMDDGAEEVWAIDRLVDSDWSAIAFTDVDGDRRADVVFRRTRDGETEVAVWRLEDGAIAEGVLTTLAGAFEECFVGNFDTDIGAEILMRRLNSGEAGAVYLAEFEGAAVGVPARVRLGSGEVAPIVSPAFTIAGVADTDGDGIDDVLWRGPNGSVEHWRMHERGLEQHSVIWDQTSTYWSVAAFPDLDGDGRRGLLFRGKAGETWSWELDGTAILSSGPLRGVEPAWSTAVLQR